MVYKTGYVNNSHELSHIVHSSMIEAGWRNVAGLKPDGYDCVLYSTGTDGYRDIYVRAAAGMSDRVMTGDVQFPSNDGYTGFVNFLCYQYFEGNSGSSEIGKVGPLVYIAALSEQPSIMKEYNPKSENTRTYVSVTDSAQFWYPKYGGATDGRRRIYHTQSWYDYAKFLMWHDLGYDNLYDSINNSIYVTTYFHPYRNLTFARKNSNSPMIWQLAESSKSWITYNIQTLEVLGTTSTSVNSISPYATCPWTISFSTAWVVQGTRRTGKKYLYVGRTGSTTDFARYNIDADTWETLSALPYACGEGSRAVMVPREASGYAYDRLYVTRAGSTTTFFSVFLDDAGDILGSWTTHTVVPFSAGPETDEMFFCGKAVYLYDGNGGGSSPVLYSWTLPTNPTDGGSWISHGNPYGAIFGYTPMVGPDEKGHVWAQQMNNLSSRVPVDEHEWTEYWLFVNKDRIVAVTRTPGSSGDKYYYAYAGLFETFSDTSVTTTKSIASSGDTTISVEDVGIFKVGSKYMILNTKSNGVLQTFPNGEQEYIGDSEQIIIQSVSKPNSSITVTAALKRTYPSGSKIGEDPQPVCVSLVELEKCQTLNAVHTGWMDSTFDKYLSHDRAYNMYKYQLVTQTTTSSRSGSQLYPAAFRCDAISGRTVTDSRGKLIGFYFRNTSGGIKPPEAITVGEKTYMGFNSPSQPISYSQYWYIEVEQ